MTFSNTSGFEFTSQPQAIVEIYSADLPDEVYPGQTITDQHGTQYRLLKCSHVVDRIYKVVLLPLEVKNA